MNALAVLVSIALTVLAVIIFVAAYTKVVGPEADINDLKRIFEVRSGIGEIKRAAQTLEFEQLLDKPYQQELSDRVKALGANAVILKNREVLYSTKKSLMKSILKKSLMLSDNAPNLDTLELDGRTFMFARADYSLHSGDEGVLLLLAPIKLKTGFYLFLGIFTVSFFYPFFF